MKKFILAALVAVASLSANAQVWLGGSVGFGVNSPKVGDSQTTFVIAPTVGYALSDKWEIALEFEYGMKTNVPDGDVKDEFRIAPFARFNFAKAGIATFFVDGGFGFGKKNYEGGLDTNTFNVGLRPGVKVELSKNIELDAKLGYLGYYNEKDVKDFFGLNVNGEALSFGVTYKF